MTEAQAKQIGLKSARRAVSVRVVPYSTAFNSRMFDMRL